MPKVVAPRKAPEREYISTCCNIPARKPRAGQKVNVTDAESGKVKSAPKGLGHWRCGGCNKACKVTSQKPQAKSPEVNNAPAAQ